MDDPTASSNEGAGAAGGFSIICVSSQAWDTPLPTNRQQIMARAARRGHNVLFVEIGGFVGFHLWRLLRSRGRREILRRMLVGEDAAPGIRVSLLLNLLPFAQRYRICNRVNWRLGGVLVRRHAQSLPRPRVLWAYDPRAADAIGSFAETFAVYDCVDDYSQQVVGPRRSRELIDALDRETAARARLVFVTTKPLLERHGSSGAHLVPNVADFEHFRPAAERTLAPEKLRELPRPVIGFAGNFLESKVDFELMAAIGHAFPKGTLLLAGPAEGGARVRLDHLLAVLPNVSWVGLQPYEKLPEVIAAFDVAVIPYLENEYTRSCFPLKLYEYLAAGKPVVASGVTSIRHLEPYISLCRTRASFVDAIARAAAEPAAGVAERMAVAAANTWEQRTARLLALIDAELQR